MATHMTHRERVMATIRHQPVDHLAVYDIIENDGLIAHYTGMVPEPGEEGHRLKGMTIARCLDMTRMPYGPNAPGSHTDADGFETVIERWTGWIRRRPFDTVEGAAEYGARQIQTLNAWQPGEADRQAMQAHLDQVDGWFRAGAEDPDDLPVLVIESGVGVTDIYARVGLELFSELMADEPELLDDWLEAENQAEIRRAHAIADPQRVPVVLVYDDLAFKTDTLFSPSWIRKAFMERCRRLVEAWHEHGVSCLFHSDGNLMPILDDLVKTGIDGLNPMETCAGMSLRTVREQYPHLFLTGGIDVSQLLPYGTVEDVLARCREAVEETGGRGYFIGSTTELHPAANARNVVAMIEFAQGATLP